MTKSKNYCKVGGKWCQFCRHCGCIFNQKQGNGVNYKLIKTCPKREQNRTISLKEALYLVNFYDVMTKMIDKRADEKNNVLGYAKVFTKLRSMKPSKTNMELLVEYCEEWNCFDALGLENNHTYAIEFVNWSTWLGMNINKESINKYSLEDIVAAALWEMTFNGYDEETVNEKKEELYNSFEECKKNINTND